MEMHLNERDPFLEARGWKPIPVVYTPSEVGPWKWSWPGAAGGLALLDAEGQVHYGLRPDGPKHMRAGSIASYKAWVEAWRANLPPGTRIAQWSTPVAPTGFGGWPEATRSSMIAEWATTLVAIGVDAMMLNGYDRYSVPDSGPADIAKEVAIIGSSIEMAEAVQKINGLPFHIGLWSRQVQGRVLDHDEIAPIVERAVASKAAGLFVWSSDEWMIGRCWTAPQAEREKCRAIYQIALEGRRRKVRWDEADRDWIRADVLHGRRNLCSTIQEAIAAKAAKAP